MVYNFLPSLLVCTLEAVDMESLTMGLVAGISGSLGLVLIMGSW